VATPADTVLTPGWRFLVGWTTAWAVVGVGVAVGISFGAGVEFGPVLRLSLLFAQVVGYSAYVSTRLVFPLLARLPFALRLLLDSLILLSEILFGSIVAVLIEPLYLLAQFRIGLLIFAGNTVLAGLVAVTLGVYDRMRRQIEASYSVLRERDALERELGVARDVQRQLLPHQAPDMPGLELAGILMVAVFRGLPHGSGWLRRRDGHHRRNPNRYRRAPFVRRGPVRRQTPSGRLGGWAIARVGRSARCLSLCRHGPGHRALYLLFAIPCLGRLVWLVAMVLSGREYLQARRSV